MDLVLTGRAVDAEEALATGLAHRVVATGTAREAAEALAREIAAFPQTCLRHDRLSLLEQDGLTEEDALANELRHGLVSLAEAADGAARFRAGEGRHGTFEPTRAMFTRGSRGNLPRVAGSGEGLDPGVVEVGEPAGPAGDQVVGGAVLDDAAVLEHQHPVGDLHRREPVRDDHRGPVGQDRAQRPLHQPLRGTSSELVASSRMSTSGSARKARANATSCRCPAESRPPLLATSVS